MALPALPPALITAFSVASLAATTIGTIRQAEAAKKRGDLQRDALNRQAENERRRTAEAEEDFRIEQSRIAAARRAAFARSGVVPTAGSPLLVGEEIARRVEHAALRIRADPAAARLQEQGLFQAFKGDVERSSLFARAGAGVLTGLPKLFGEG